MNVTLIEMDKEQAKEKLRAYRTAKHKDAEEEYQACAKAYEQMAKGHPLVNLTDAIIAGGVDEKGWPRLAIARADKKEVRFSWRSNEAHYDFRDPDRWDTGYDMQLLRRIPWQGKGNDRWNARFALVPMVPADARPETGNLRDWHILWEVDHWAERSSFAVASHDPLLLKHVDGDLYAVLAAWDLTPLEQSILNSIRRPAR